MIRFLNLKGQINDEDSSFAFFDTCTNEIINFDGDQVFDSEDDFLNSYNSIPKSYRRPVDRYLSKIPDNFFDKK